MLGGTLDAKDITAVITVVIVVGSLLYALGRMLGGSASQKDLFDLDRKFTNQLNDKAKESIQEHKIYATKSEVTRIENTMDSDIRELRDEMREGLKQITEQYNKMLGYMDGLVSQLTKKGS